MAAAIADLIDRIQRTQASLGITLHAAAAEAELLAFERAKGIQLPADIRTFYKFSNGFDSAEDLFRIIPLGEIIANGPDKYLPSPLDFYIAEYMIYCDTWVVSIKPADAETCTIYNASDEPVILTDSFAEFLEVFLNQGVFRGLYDWPERLLGQQLVSLAPELPYSTRVHELDQLAESVSHKLTLTYDAKGVKFVEEFIERNKGQLAPEKWQGLITSLGSFLGRCIILNYGGTWQQDEEHGPHVAFDERNKVYPFGKVAKQFENGLEDSIYSFYTVIPAVFKLGPPAPAAAAAPAAPRKPWYKFW